VESKVIQFDYNEEVLSDICEQRIRNGDFIGAVRLYRDAISKKPWDFDLNVALADAYTGTSLNRYALNCWFRALASAKSKEEKARAYNGLGATYYYLGKEDLCMHYFVSQLKNGVVEEDLPYDDVISELNDGVINRHKEPIYKVLDVHTEFGKKCDLAMRFLTMGDSEGVYEVVSSLRESLKNLGEEHKENAHKLLSALVFTDENELAREVAEILYEQNDKSFIVYYALCWSNLKLGNKENGEWAYNQIKKMKLDTDGAFRMLALTLDIGMDEGSLEYAKEIIKIEPENAIALYICGLVNYNLGNYDDAVDYIKKAYYLTGEVAIEDMLCTVNLPKEQRPERLRYKMDLNLERLLICDRKLRSNENGEGKTIDEIIENSKCVIGARAFDLFGLVVHLGLLTGYDKYISFLKQCLLNVDILDDVKIRIVKEMISCELFGEYPIVVNGLYKVIDVKPCPVDVFYMHDLLTEAYAIGASALYVLDNGKLAKFEKKFEQVVNQFLVSDTQIDATPNALAGGIMYLCRIQYLSGKDMICEVVGTERAELNKVLKVITPKKGEK